MTLDEVSDLLKAGEGECLEFKSELPDGDDAAATLAAFANGLGGVLLVGVQDDGRPVGVGEPDSIAQRLACLARDACRPAITPQIGQILFGNLRIVWARMTAQPGQTCLVRGIRYIRVGPTTRSDHGGLTREALVSRLPPLVDRFRGRDPELKRLHHEVIRGSSRLILIEGISGIGKTALAAKLAQLVEGDGRRIFWLDCHRETSFEDLTLELGRVARANGELALADLLDEGGGQGSPSDRVVRVVSALSRCRYVLFLDDYHRVVDRWFDEFLSDFSRRSAYSKTVLCVSQRPRLLDLASSANRKEEYMEVGLDPDACRRFLQDAGFEVSTEEAQKVYTVCGRGHPKALSLFAALAGRVPIVVLLRTLPQFEDKLRDEWLLPLLGGLSSDERQLVLDLAIFERRVPIRALRRLHRERSVDTLLLKLAQGFILDYEGTEHVHMHELLRQSCYKLVENPRQRHTEAAQLYLDEVEALDGEIPIDRTIEALLAAWAHLIQAEDTERASNVLDQLRPLLMQRGKYSQLLLLIDQTPATDLAKVQWRGIDRARVFGLQGDVDRAIALLDPLLASDDKRLGAEATLVLAAIYNSQGRPKEAVGVLTARFRRGGVLGRTSRLASRVADAYLIADSPGPAFELAAQVSMMCEHNDDKLGGGIAVRQMATASRVQGDAERALEFALHSQELLREWAREAALSGMEVGLAWAALGVREKALEALEAAERALTEIGDRVSGVTCRRHIVTVRGDSLHSGVKESLERQGEVP